MKFFTTLIAASSFLFSCQETHPDLSGTNPFESAQFSVLPVKTEPESINPDTLTGTKMPVRIYGKAVVSEKTTLVISVGQQSNGGYQTSVSEELIVSPGLPDFILNIEVPFDPARLSSPVFFLSASEKGSSAAITQTGIIQVASYSGSTSAIDSIRFSPPAGAKPGSSFSMQIWCSDLHGPENLKDVFVIGKRPDGTVQTPFSVPPGPTAGSFFLAITIPESSQTGTYTWTFYSRNKGGRLSQPVTRTYQVNPK
ncbi:MAG: hypothetical protein L6Q77_05000 [Bacteroidetes bacterium]|nr:hypothetical protein [Bacteroidota bacterium]